MPTATPNAPTSSRSRTVRFAIVRCDGPGKPERTELFDVPVEPGANIISCLQWIAANPVTIEGVRTTPPTWDSGCLEEVCGSCTMNINGRVRQACSALIDAVSPSTTPPGPGGATITLEPMRKFPVVRDLCVDRARFFRNLERIKAWVPVDGTYSLGAGPTESPDHQATRYALSTCMTCGCCLEACPQFLREDKPEAWDTSFVGAAVISQAVLFNDHPTGATLKPQRLDVLSGPGGVNDCGNSQNCVKVCPKEIPLTESIGAAGRQVTVHAVKKFFSGR